MNLKNLQLEAFKKIFLENAVKYKATTLPEKCVSIGKVPFSYTTPHLNIQFSGFTRNPALTGVADQVNNSYTFSFIVKPSSKVGNQTGYKITNFVEDTEDFLITYIDYLLDKYRYGYDNLWHFLEQTAQNEPVELDNHNFLITIILTANSYRYV